MAVILSGGDELINIHDVSHENSWASTPIAPSGKLHSHSPVEAN